MGDTCEWELAHHEITKLAKAGAAHEYALGGPSDEGRSSYQVFVTRCDDCKRTTMEGHGQSVFVDEMVAETVDCDAQRIDDAGKAKQDVPPATRRLVMRRPRRQVWRATLPKCAVSRSPPCAFSLRWRQ